MKNLAAGLVEASLVQGIEIAGVTRALPRFDPPFPAPVHSKQHSAVSTQQSVGGK